MNLSEKNIEKIFPDDNMKYINRFVEDNWKGFLDYDSDKINFVLKSPTGKRWDSKEINYFYETYKFFSKEAREAKEFLDCLTVSFRRYPLVRLLPNFPLSSLN